MPKIIACIHECKINPVSKKAAIAIDISSDWINPFTGEALELNHIPMEIVLGSSITQMNNHIRQGVLDFLRNEGYETGMAVTDITLFGGAQ